jgi:hypothetical protein
VRNKKLKKEKSLKKKRQGQTEKGESLTKNDSKLFYSLVNRCRLVIHSLATKNAGKRGKVVEEGKRREKKRTYSNCKIFSCKGNDLLPV